jgi:mRNA interferase HigB
MRIITFKRINEFSEIYPDSKIALAEWYHKTKKAVWNNLNDVRKTFNSVDYIGNNRYVFNIRGNHYRLVAIIIFASQKVYIRYIGTHSEYEKIDCTNI